MPKFFQYLTSVVAPTAAQTGTSEPLLADGTWSSVPYPTASLSALTGSVFANVAGQLWIEQSNDREHWDIQSEYDVPANDGKGFSEDLLLEWVRVRYVNGSAGQTDFRLHFLLK